MNLHTAFILASQSPRRRRMLQRIGLRFDVEVSETDEHAPDGLEPAALTEMLALRKADDVGRRHPEALTLGADTLVVLDGEILGKPASADEAAGMLRRLSANTHVVYTGIALVHPTSGRFVTASEATRVTFAAMDEKEIGSYVASGSPMDKAGAYGIQDDRGALFVRRIDGDYYNVVGLPLQLFYRIMKEHFADLMTEKAPR